MLSLVDVRSPTSQFTIYKWRQSSLYKLIL